MATATRQPLSTLLWLVIVSLATLLLALWAGSIRVSPAALWRDAPALDQTILLNLRLPRALTSFAVGGLLGLAGMVMQVLLRNPLADPYVLGTSGGAAIGALSALALGLAGWWLSGAAAVGAFASILLVFALAHSEGTWSPTRLLLVGVVFSAGATAVVSLLLTLGNELQLRSMVFWLMGDIRSDAPAGWLWLLLGLSTLLTVGLARHLNLLARGELQAQALGMPLTAMRQTLFGLSAVLTAATVVSVGSIGFIGLLVPHLGRRLTGTDHRYLSLAVVLLGGILLTLADTAARTLLAPRQLPVGALTAVVGVPLFLLALRQKH